MRAFTILLSSRGAPPPKKKHIVVAVIQMSDAYAHSSTCCLLSYSQLAIHIAHILHVCHVNSAFDTHAGTRTEGIKACLPHRNSG